MNKMICTFVVMLLIATIVLPVSGTKNSKELNESAHKIVNKMGDPPEWADGEFNGTYGKIFLGKPSDELGWAKGYWSSDPIRYSLFEKGRIECYFGEWGNEAPISIMETNLFSHFKHPFYHSVLIGTITELATENKKFCTCLGKIGIDGTLNYNIIVINGDNVYFIGTYSEY